MKIEAWYSRNFESRLGGRYITLKHINPLLKEYTNSFIISSAGISELGKDIPLLKIGSGKKIILAWSQMHGNETTTTKSIFDFLKFLVQKDVFKAEIRNFLDIYTLYIIPILNPDGAVVYTRENSNLVDLNRDGEDLTQKESKILNSIFKELNPHLCLNLHGQRTIFGLQNGFSSTISFLSPAADEEQLITPSRKEAMNIIVRMNKTLRKYIPNQVGRYDDSFNSACVGDAFQMEGVPTILIEAGHIGEDYMREKTREYVFYSFLSLFGITNTIDNDANYNNYYLIPENKKNYKDFILRNVRIDENEDLFSLSIQYSEKLENGKIIFLPELDCIGDLNDFYGHIDKDGEGAVILVDSQKNLIIGNIISTIVNKNDNSLVYFNKNNFLS